MTTPELSLLRLVSQALAGRTLADPTATVAHLGAVQAQDLPGAMTSVALRSETQSCRDVADAFAQGRVVRSWPLRGTLHLVPAADLGWMLSLTADRMISGAAHRRVRLGITDELIDRARDIALAALVGGVALTRSELFALWKAADLLPQPMAGGHLLALLCQQASLVLGPMAGTEQLVVGYAEWITNPRQLDPDAALAELARRFLQSHGPATAADLSRWSSIPLTQARRAVGLVAAEFVSYTVDSAEYLMAPDLPDRLAEYRSHAKRLLLLPGFDEFMLGYGDRTFAVPATHLDRIVPGNNGMFRPTIVKGGEVIGVWKRAGSKTRPRFEPEPFAPLNSREATAAQAAFAALPRS